MRLEVLWNAGHDLLFKPFHIPYLHIHGCSCDPSGVGKCAVNAGHVIPMTDEVGPFWTRARRLQLITLQQIYVLKRERSCHLLLLFDVWKLNCLKLSENAQKF